MYLFIDHHPKRKGRVVQLLGADHVGLTLKRLGASHTRCCCVFDRANFVQFCFGRFSALRNPIDLKQESNLRFFGRFRSVGEV